RPILCFINACESALEGAPNACESALEGAPDPSHLHVYNIGRWFLRTGAYLLGSRWKIHDLSAEAFARTFYRSLLKDAQPIGEAVRLARLACKQEVPYDLGWASYVFYGDPRIRFKRDAEGVPDAGPSAQNVLAVNPPHRRAGGDPEPVPEAPPRVQPPR